MENKNNNTIRSLHDKVDALFDLYAQQSVKIERLDIDKIEEVLASQRSIESRVLHLEATISSLDRALRGSNGEGGIITDIVLLKDARDRVGDPVKDIAVRYVGPVIMAFLFWFLFDVLPNILNHVEVIRR